MKDISKKKKVVLTLSILLIITGIINLVITGFEKTAEYKAGTRIEVYIPQGYEKQDIINMANESFNGKSYSFEEVEKLNQVVGIRINDYTEDELNSFKAKISEKYQIEEEKLEMYEIKLPKTRISTLVKPYMFPVILVTILSLIYVLFRNLKSENKWKNVARIVLILTLVLGVYFSLILVLRLPFGNYTMPIALAIYIITLILSVNDKK